MLSIFITNVIIITIFCTLYNILYIVHKYINLNPLKKCAYTRLLIYLYNIHVEIILHDFNI